MTDRNALASITMAPSHTRLMNGFVLISIASVSLAAVTSASGSFNNARPVEGSPEMIDNCPPLGR